jgi:hypothetical protein
MGFGHDACLTFALSIDISDLMSVLEVTNFDRIKNILLENMEFGVDGGDPEDMVDVSEDDVYYAKTPLDLKKVFSASRYEEQKQLPSLLYVKDSNYIAHSYTWKPYAEHRDPVFSPIDELDVAAAKQKMETEYVDLGVKLTFGMLMLHMGS